MQEQNTPSQPGQSAVPKRKRADTSGNAEHTMTSSKRRCLASSLCISSDDSGILSAIDTRYDVQLQSVISSSKMQKRVSSILRHLTTPPSRAPATESTSIAKTRLSVLRAKATDAGKLVSIAEIAKREIEREQSEPTGDGVMGETGQAGNKGRWFQYIALGEELQQRDRVKDSAPCTDGEHYAAADDDDAFEIMKTPFERAIEGRPLVRGVPVMSLFLSRMPVEELKRRYGEQTNAPT